MEAYWAITAAESDLAETAGTFCWAMAPRHKATTNMIVYKPILILDRSPMVTGDVWLLNCFIIYNKFE